MHVIDPFPRRIVVAGLAALGLALAAAALPPTLSDVSFGSSDQRVAPAAPVSTAAPAHARPAWLRDPLASPVRELAGR